MKAILVIGGSDCSSGAGIQRDLNVLFEKKIYGVSVITAVTAQNSNKFYSFQSVSKKQIINQLNAIFDEFDVKFVKLGMLANAKIVETVSYYLSNKNLTIIYDPVMKSSSGGNLIDSKFIDSIKQNLFSIIELLTPNFNELEALLGYKINDLEENGLKEIYEQLKVKNLLIKGGHITNPSLCTDYLITNNHIYTFQKERLEKNFRGTGCSLATSIVCEMYKGRKLENAVDISKEWLWKKMERNEGIIFCN